MKKSTAKTTMVIIAIGTTGLAMAMPTIIHQLTLFIAGFFAMLTALALFLVGQGTDAPTEHVKAARSDAETINAVVTMRACDINDYTIAQILGLDIDVVRAIP